MSSFIHPTSVIYPGVEIGDNVIIDAFCVIGGRAEHKNYLDTFGKVIIEDNVRITNYVTVSSGTERPTIIGEGSLLLDKCYVGHDCIIGKGVTISPGAKVGGHTLVGAYSNLGLNSVIHQRQVISEGVMIGMGAVLTKKLYTQTYKTYAGNPAKLIGENEKHPNYTIYMEQFPFGSEDNDFDARLQETSANGKVYRLH
jgi:UDP-N-acetylglucosamine acyltransferase